MLRLGIVAAVLVLPALSGAILAAAAGWAVGLAALGTWFMVSSGKQAVASSNAHSKAAVSSMQLRIFGDPVLFHLGPLPITETMVTSTAVTVVLFAMAALLETSRCGHVRSIGFPSLRSWSWRASTIWWKRSSAAVTRWWRRWPAACFCSSLAATSPGNLPGVHPATGSLGHDLGAGGRCVSECPDCRHPHQRGVGLHQALLSSESVADAAARDLRVVAHAGIGRSSVREHHVGAFGGRACWSLWPGFWCRLRSWRSIC